jgi:acetylglutamate kinase
MIEEAVRKADTLLEALPYIKAFRDRFIVVKLGGSAQEDEEVLRHILADVDFMRSVGMRPVVVYGGGKRISAAMAESGREARFVHGQRVTDEETMAIVARVLVDEVGADLLRLMREAGGEAELVNGRDQGFLRAVKKHLPEYPEIDLGHVGTPVAIDASVVYDCLARGHVPLVAPVACGVGTESGLLYNVNGDTASALIARDLHAEKIAFLSDTPGVCRAPGEPSSLIPHLDRAGVRGLIGEGVIEGGMIPKAEACLHALEGGVGKAHIVLGAQPHALLLEIFTRAGVGTEIVL